MPFGSGSAGATLIIKVVSDATDAAKGLDQAATGVSSFQRNLGRSAAFAGIAAAGVIAFGDAAFDAASTAEQAGGAVDAVFKDSAGAIHDFAKDAASELGLSESAYEQMASVFGAQLKNMGVAADDLVPTTDDLLGVGADLAAQFGGSTADAVAALSSLLRGERDPIERYGVSIKQADIEAKKAAMGLDGLTGEADKAATTQATLALLYDQTADATGAFARESDTAAGQQQRANAEFEDAKASLGRALLPLVAKGAQLFSRLAKFVGQNARVFQILGAAVVVIAAALGIMVGAMRAYKAIQTAVAAATKIWAAVQWVLNAALNANPIGLVVIAIAALIAGIILAYKNCETFRNIVDAAARLAVRAFGWVVDAVKQVWEWVKIAWNWIKSNWPLLLAIITGPIGIAVYMIRRYWDQIIAVIKTVIGWIKGAFVAAWNWLRTVVISVITTIRAWLNLAIASIQRVVGWLRDNLASAWRFVRDVVSGVVANIRTYIQWVIDKLSALWGWIVNNIGNAWGRMWSAASWVLGLIRDAIGWVIDKLNALWGWLVSNMGNAWGAMYNSASWVLGLIRDAIQWVINKIDALIGWIGRIHFPSPPGWLSSAVDWVMPGMAPFPTPPEQRFRYSVAGPAVGARGTFGGMMGGSTAASGVTINVNGALDPDRVARQIERILKGRARRVRGVRMGVL